MKNTTPSNHNRAQEKTPHSIPDLDIIDLDADAPTIEIEPDFDSDDLDSEEFVQETGSGKSAASLLSRINMHIVLLVVLVIFVAGIAYKFSNWGEFVDLDEIFKDGQGTYEDTLDSMLPLISADGDPIYMNYGEDSTILFLGNDPLADDRDSEDNLVNMIRQMTGATVYNCSVSGSYMAAKLPALYPDQYPMDIFNFYWLCTLSVGNAIDNAVIKGIEIMGENAPPEAQYVFDTLSTIDLNTVDVIAIMYDASDYLAGHEMYSDQNNTNIQQFTGNMEAGIQLVSDNYPNIRFIVMSPAYAYGLDEEGNYVSSDIQRYGQDVLSTYVIKQADSCAFQSVTFIDNLYGTITQDNADEYLTDHIHLNVEGRKKVAQRFVDALYYFNQE